MSFHHFAADWNKSRAIDGYWRRKRLRWHYLMTCCSSVLWGCPLELLPGFKWLCDLYICHIFALSSVLAVDTSWCSSADSQLTLRLEENKQPGCFCSGKWWLFVCCEHWQLHDAGWEANKKKCMQPQTVSLLLKWILHCCFSNNTATGTIKYIDHHTQR